MVHSLRRDDRGRYDERYYKHVERLERWRIEYERHKAVEDKIAAVSKFSFEQVDYSKLLVKVPFEEKPIPSFDHLVIDARKKVEDSFFYPLLLRLAGFFILMVIMIILPNAATLWGCGSFGFLLLASWYYMKNRKTVILEEAVRQAEEEVKQRVEAEKRAIEKARKEHEAAEEQRVGAFTRLLEGELSSIIWRLDQIFRKMTLPVMVEADIDLYRGVPSIRVYLPPNTEIPRQLCLLAPNGHISYQEKEIRQVYKQYFELIAAIVIQIISRIYENIPSFNKGYVHGILKNDSEDTVLVSASFDRESLINACRVGTGIAALQLLEANFDTDTDLALKNVEKKEEEEWDQVETKKIRTLHIKIFKK